MLAIVDDGEEGAYWVVRVQVFPLPSTAQPDHPSPGFLVMMLPPSSRQLVDIEELEPALPFLHFHLVGLVIEGIAQGEVDDPPTCD
jgi:hypothetical protein